MKSKRIRRSAARNMRAGGESVRRLTAASARVGLLSSIQNAEGVSPRRLPDALFRGTTGSALSAVTVSCFGQPSSATPRGGPRPCVIPRRAGIYAPATPAARGRRLGCLHTTPVRAVDRLLTKLGK
eukprot:2058965-Pleurochrysis_carterae.AAC.2